MTGAPLSVPLINRVIKQLDMNNPRTVYAKLEINNGNLTAPEIKAETPVGTLFATGTCSEKGILDYNMRVNLNQKTISLH